MNFSRRIFPKFRGSVLGLQPTSKILKYVGNYKLFRSPDLEKLKIRKELQASLLSRLQEFQNTQGIISFFAFQTSKILKYDKNYNLFRSPDLENLKICDEL